MSNYCETFPFIKDLDAKEAVERLRRHIREERCQCCTRRIRRMSPTHIAERCKAQVAKEPDPFKRASLKQYFDGLPLKDRLLIVLSWMHTGDTPAKKLSRQIGNGNHRASYQHQSFGR